MRLTHVGSSTMTRRPLRIHAQHDATCKHPELYLRREGADGKEEKASEAQVRSFVEAENERLERSAEVDDAEICIRLRWCHAPNAVFVDTPGLPRYHPMGGRRRRPTAQPVWARRGGGSLARASEAAGHPIASSHRPPAMCLPRGHG